MKETFLRIIRQEQRQLESEIAAEQRSVHPDLVRLAMLQREESSLRRQLERIPDA